MVSELNRLTEEDLSKNIVAVWHDESFINKYIVGRENVQVLGPQYLGYEEYVHPYKAPIILRNKRKNLDLNSFRNISKKENVSILKIKMFLRNLKERLLIILGIRNRIYIFFIIYYFIYIFHIHFIYFFFFFFVIYFFNKIF